MLAVLQSTNHERITNALRGIRGRAGLHLLLFPLKYRDKKRSLGVFDNRKIFSESQHPENFLACFPWVLSPMDYIFLQLSLNYKNKLVCLWWDPVLPHEFWLCALFVNSCLDGLWWQCCQHSRKPATWRDCLSRTAQEGAPSCHRQRGDTCHCPPYAVTPQGLLGNRSSLGFVFTLSWMVICVSIAGDGLCHSNLTPRLRELHCGLFSPDLDKLTWNS